MHHGHHGRGEGADGADQLFQRVVVAQRVPLARGELADVMAGRPDVHARRGAQHDRADLTGAHALQRGDDPAGHLGADGVALVAIPEGDDADLADHVGLDGGALRAVPGLGACGGCFIRYLFVVAVTGGQGHVDPGRRVLARSGDLGQQSERLDQLLARQGAGQLAPEHLGQDGEGSLDLGQGNARSVRVRCDLLRRPDDRLGAARAYAAQDEAEQLPHLAAAAVREG